MEQEPNEMETEQSSREKARLDEAAEFDKFNEQQKEKFADAANVEDILQGFESSRVKKTQDEFIQGFNDVRDQLKPYFEKYGLSEPACFKDIEAGDDMVKAYYDVMLAGYGLLREKMSE